MEWQNPASFRYMYIISIVYCVCLPSSQLNCSHAYLCRKFILCCLWSHVVVCTLLLVTCIAKNVIRLQLSLILHRLNKCCWSFQGWRGSLFTCRVPSSRATLFWELGWTTQFWQKLRLQWHSSGRSVWSQPLSTPWVARESSLCIGRQSFGRPPSCWPVRSFWGN